jgi:protein TonB
MLKKLVTYISASSDRILIFIVAASLCLHVLFFSSVTALKHLRSDSRPQKVKLRIVKQEKVQPEPEVVPEKPPPEKVPPKPKVPEQRQAKKPPEPKAEKVQGLSEDSFVAPGAQGLSVAAGNTLMKEDEGKRLTPEQIAALKKDLSADAILIQGSFKDPEYTPEALEANLEGKYVVDVFVTEDGSVTECELRKKIGYGMDSKVLAVAKSARFIPRKNAKGIPIAGWAEIKFFLEIP